MRDIKFRAWHRDTNTLLEWDAIKRMVLGEFEDNSNYVFEQFTGLLDKNGIKIWEGDILTHPTMEGFDRFVAPFDPVYRYLPTLKQFGSRCEVIGNIHENPELLSRKED